jgi:hypothetical protein
VALRSAAIRDPFSTTWRKRHDHSRDYAQFKVDDTVRNYDVSSYRLRGSFDWETAALDASVTIALSVTDRRATQLEFDSRVDVTSATVDGRPASFHVDASAGLLTVDLADRGTRRRPIDVTIKYRAPLSSGLHVSSGRDGDPIPSRILSTDSEPIRGYRWMPGNHRPNDRARFAIDMEIATSEDLIANGRRLPDEITSAGHKRIRYESDFDLPTYVMAFAMGDFVHVDSAEPGETPLSVWHRRGIEVDVDALLVATRRAMRIYERLLGPYPYATYSQVLLPAGEYRGMENASITFLLEVAAQTSVMFDYVAHELAHQWYGDLVTVDTWDDLWVKEGMATLLAKEAARGTQGRAEGRLFGDSFLFRPRDAIRDRSLGSQDEGWDRYTSGPYERAAWLLTQIRASVGDDAFWSAARHVLRTRRFGSIGSDDFIAILTRGMDRAVVAKIKASLDAKGAPVLSVTSRIPTPSFTWSIDDPSGTLISPIELTTIDSNGTAAVQRLSPGAPVETNIDPGGYLAFDERDVHPHPFHVFGLKTGALTGATAPPLMATSGAARAAFAQRSSAVQELAFGLGARLATPEEFTTLYPLLDSEMGKQLAIVSACASLSSAPAGPAYDAWLQALLPAVATTRRTDGMLLDLAPYAVCGTELPTRAFASELLALQDDTTPGAAARLEYLLGFDYGTDPSFDAISHALRRPGNAQLRDSALNALVFHTDPLIPFSPIASADHPKWKALLSEAIAKSTSGPWLFNSFLGAYFLSDTSALPLLAQKLKTLAIDSGHQRDFICLAHDLATSESGAWERFGADLQPWTMFDPSVQEVLAAPAACP